MYGLPQEFDCSELISLELVQLCVAEYSLSLHFGDRAAVFCHRAISVSLPTGRYKRLQVRRFTLIPRALLMCLGSRIVAAAGRAGTLKMDLSNGVSLEVHDQPGYEAYEVHLGSRRIIV